MEATKKYTLKVYSNWMAGLENAYVSITNPITGKTLRFEKWHRLDKLRSEADWSLLHDIHSADSIGTINLTIEQMQILADMYKRENPTATINSKTTSFKQRKFIASKSSSRNMCCGKYMKIKDHGTWEGYYCSVCKSGGSRNKK